MQLINHNPFGSRSSSYSVFIKEGQFSAKNITSNMEKMMAHRLRHKVFSQELGWVPQTSNSLEIDGYDENALYFGVFDECQNLKAFLRIVTSRNTFMMEKEFNCLLDQNYEVRKKNDTAEISRLCVAPEARNERLSGNFGVHSVSMLLYKGVYHWCLKNSVRYLYLVVGEKVYRLLCASGFPCKLVGNPKIMPDGVIAVAALLDLRAFEDNIQINNPKMFSWFRQYQSGLSPRQLPPREAGLPHQVLS